GLPGLLELARAQAPSDQRDLLRRHTEPVQRVAGHLAGELFLAEHHLIRASLSKIVGRVAGVRTRHDADALVRAPRVLDDAARGLWIAEGDHEKDRAIQMRPFENQSMAGITVDRG